MVIFKSRLQSAMLTLNKHVHYTTSVKVEPTINNNSGNTLKSEIDRTYIFL